MLIIYLISIILCYLGFIYAYHLDENLEPSWIDFILIFSPAINSIIAIIVWLDNIIMKIKKFSFSNLLENIDDYLNKIFNKKFLDNFFFIK